MGASSLSSRLYCFHVLSRNSFISRACLFSVNAKVKRRQRNSPKKKDEDVKLNYDCDIISPPDDLTNLRRVQYFIPPHETSVEKKFRLQQEKVQEWNDSFWKEHNSQFIKESKAFKKKKLKSCTDEEKKTLNAEEMSEFYKAYLDKNWNRHVSYNFEWYRKNVYLVYLALKVQISRVRNVFRRKGNM